LPSPRVRHRSSPPETPQHARALRSTRDVAQLRLARPLQGQGLRLQALLHHPGTLDPVLVSASSDRRSFFHKFSNNLVVEPGSDVFLGGNSACFLE
jgi:hypothetical protein